MKIDGGCHCGNITFVAEIDPDQVTVCHCTDCQVQTGSAFRVVVRAPKDKFELRGGKPKTYIKTAESGTKRVQAFCPECGTPIYSTNVGEPQVYGLRIGTIRQRGELRPVRQQWCRSALGWVMELREVPQVAKQGTN
jgi:hypothetical protein